MEQEQPVRRSRRKKKKFRLRGIVFLMFIAILAIGAYAFMQFQSGHKLAEENSELPTIAFDGDPENKDFENILVLGVDARGDEISRTDTMMLVSHNKKTDEVKVTSFMRDIYATIPGYQSYKLNTAYYLGVKETGKVEDGVALLADTIRSMFGVEIQHFAMIDFKSFEKLVDVAAPNGVEIDVEKAMSKHIGVTLTPGVQQLNGKELLGYARFRADNEGDFGRVRRQQQVMSALKEEVVSVSAIPKYPKLAGAAQGYIQTDLTVGDQIKMATSVAMNGGAGVERLTLPVKGSYSFASYPHAGSVIEMNLEQNKQALSEFLSQPLD
ncbi:LCP family protein [Planococcus sp. N028]|uniref:Regulatory protein MsrR n=1 Tax=Planococcus shixiaomingii TaxID=3058393 RepID=A0ABT8MZD5_9BACL|nr:MULTISPECIES: LCP family protein [unclassified Planococcus (in: firmicutes)]MDN7241001.1 LCP family protein [Planococcus sp. N028]WKA53255.1 LCP family protein [Planococcus sp. N022]